MRTHGTVTRWNTDRGFGFITPSGGGDDVFVHVTAFPRAGGAPRIGELVSFDLEPGDKGKPRAVRVQRPPGQTQARSPAPARSPRPRRDRRTSSLGIAAMGLALVGGVVAYVLSNRPSLPAQSSVAPPAAPAPMAQQLISEQPVSQCDGRKYCSQMTSCAEATYFLANCPGVEMDGDGDGVACEKQWCD